MNNAISKPFLGTGWSFPPHFDKQAKAVEMVSDEQDIKESLMILLTTQQGERVMNHNYGTGMEQMIFDPLTTSLKTYMINLVENAVHRFEPRVDLNKVEMEDSGELEGRVIITIYFTIRATNSRSNIVFPFYKNEGTNI